MMASVPELSPQAELVWQVILHKHNERLAQCRPNQYEPHSNFSQPQQSVQQQQQQQQEPQQRHPIQEAQYINPCTQLLTQDFDSYYRRLDRDEPDTQVGRHKHNLTSTERDGIPAPLFNVSSDKPHGSHRGQGDPILDCPDRLTESVQGKDGTFHIPVRFPPLEMDKDTFQPISELYPHDNSCQLIPQEPHSLSVTDDQLHTFNLTNAESPLMDFDDSPPEWGSSFLKRMTEVSLRQEPPKTGVSSMQDNEAESSLPNQSPSARQPNENIPDADANILSNTLCKDTIAATPEQPETESRYIAPHIKDRKMPTAPKEAVPGVNRTLFKVPLAQKVAEKKRRHSIHTDSERGLQDIEDILDSTVKKKPRATPKFKNPGVMIKERPTLATDKITIPKVCNLNEEKQEQLRKDLLDAPEVAFTLTYSDGSSLLGPPPGHQQNLKKSTAPKYLEGVVIAYPKRVGEGVDLGFIMFNLSKDFRKVSWISPMLEELMVGKSRKICYKADELILALCKNAWINPGKDILKWMVLDPGVAHWLLHSDQPSKTFTDILQSLPSLGIKCSASEAETVRGRLKLVGPAMAQLYSELKKARLWDLFLNLETPLTPILTQMNLNGIKVNKSELVNTAQLLQRKISQLEEAAHMSVGKKFCLNSHAQLRQVLFEDLKLDKKLDGGSKIARTEVEGQKSTSQSVLQQLKGTHPLPAIVLEHRHLQKLKSTYVEGLLSCVETSGMIHTRWTQVSASTGRLAATQPNLQAVPKLPVQITVTNKACVGKPSEQISIYARDPFHSRSGYSLLAADFQQIELRLLAHLSADPALLTIFNEGTNTDIFIQLTAQWLDKKESDVTPADREQTKRVVYSVIYGVGKEKLSDYLKIDSANAKGIIQSFLVTYPGVNSFTKYCVQQAKRQGYQMTLFGRRRQLPHINHSSFQARSQAERQAVNFCVQGSAADLCKASMILVQKALAEKPELDARLLLQIHDELLFEVKTEDLHQVAGIIKSTMEDRALLCGSRVELRVPLTVSLSLGQRWGHMETYRPPST